ncbi:LOW QUALITY PROTEIN: calmodulin-regulated spectrin-associated protein 1-B [Ciona intestinalis]
MRQFDVPDSDAHYDVEKAKIRSSLTWLLGVVCIQHPACNVEKIFNENEEVTRDVQEFLISGWPYRQCIRMIFDTNIQQNGFDAVIQALCRHEFYILKSNDPVLTSQQLSSYPLNLNSHIQLIDMIMFAASSKMWICTETLVKSIKKFSSFYASRELPGNTEEAVVLWLSKVVTKVQHLEQTTEPHKKPSDPCLVYPVVTSKLEDICDSAVIALVLHYYCPTHIPINDIVLKEDTSMADALHNLTMSLQFAFDEVLTQENPPFLTPDDFISCHDNLQPNFIAFFAQLFHCLEIAPISDKIVPRGHEVKTSEKVTIATKSDAPHISTASTSSVSSQNSAFFPNSNISSLISDATERSFLPPEEKLVGKHCAPTTNLLTTSSQSDSDLHIPYMGIPQKPLLPRRHQEDRPHSTNPRFVTPIYHGVIRKSSSLHNILNGELSLPAVTPPSAWNQCNDTQSRRQWTHPSMTQQSLLSKVEMDAEIDQLLSERSVTSSMGAGDSRNVDISWKGFTSGKPPPTPGGRSARINDGDLTIETVRTNDFRSPVSTSRGFYARPLLSQNSYDDSASELTSVSTITGSASSTTNSYKPQNDFSANVSRVSPEKSTLTEQNLKFGQNSYTVHSGAFQSMESARAAGYPVIGEPSHVMPSRESYHDMKTSQSDHPNSHMKGSVSCESGMTSSMMTSSKNKLQRNTSLAEVASQTEKPSNSLSDQMNPLETKLNEAFRLFNQLKMEVENMKRSNHRSDSVTSNLTQLKQAKYCNQSKLLPTGVNKDESSSDYSSKSPSPASTNREQHQQQQQQALPLKSHLTRIHENFPESADESTLCEGSNVALVQRKLDQLQLSVERERTKQRVSDLDREVEELHKELNEIKKSSLHLNSSSEEPKLFSASPVKQNALNSSFSDPGKPPVITIVEANSPVIGRSLDQSGRSVGGSENKDQQRAQVETRRSLFSNNGSEENKENSEMSLEKHLQVTKPAHEISVTYDSFSCRLESSSSCKSTPAKSAPASPNADEVQTTLNESDRKGGLGFTILEEKSPANTLAKKKEKFLLSRLKKEEEMRKKQIEREAELENKKREAREQQEAIQQKKMDERMKRDRRLNDFKMRKKQEEEAANQRLGIIGAASTKKHTNKVKSNHHVPADQAESIQNLLNFDAPTNYAYTDLNSAKNTGRSGAETYIIEDTESVGSGGGSGSGSEYTGPKLFKKLSSKSNRALIHNALCHCCLPGKVNESARNKILQDLEQTDSRHLMVLFRDNKCQYRALYSYNPETEKLIRISGNGPHHITPTMIESLFKYNSGRRSFTRVPSKTLSVSIDAITIKQSLWQASKK